MKLQIMDEAQVEIVARAMCMAMGEDPDKEAYYYRGPRWHSYQREARLAIAAHQVLYKAST